MSPGILLDLLPEKNFTTFKNKSIALIKGNAIKPNTPSPGAQGPDGMAFSSMKSIIKATT